MVIACARSRLERLVGFDHVGFETNGSLVRSSTSKESRMDGIWYL